MRSRLLHRLLWRLVLPCALAGCGSEDGNAVADAASPSDAGGADATTDAAGDATPDPGSHGRVLWHWHRDSGEGPIRYTAPIGYDNQYVFTGGWMGGAKMFRLDGDGTPEWEFDKSRLVLTAAASSTDVFYALWSADPELEVYRFSAASADPLWTYDAAAAGFALTTESPGLISASRDGQTLAVSATRNGTAAILFFHPDGAVPIATFVDPIHEGAPQIRLSADGKKCTFHAGTIVGRVDVATGQLEGSYDVGAGTQYVAASPDGTVVVHGFQDLNVLEWTGAAFQLAWKIHSDTQVASAYAVAADNDSIVVAWASFLYDKSVIKRYSRAGGVTPVWTYDQLPVSGNLQDVPQWVSISDDGEWMAVASWGSENNANPEVSIFRDSSDARPYYGFDSPGSIFHVDMSTDGRYVTGAGKAVHANTTASGGDVFALELFQE
jgi:hypothetical protein